MNQKGHQTWTKNNNMTLCFSSLQTSRSNFL